LRKDIRCVEKGDYEKTRDPVRVPGSYCKASTEI
jgi:hypothetical protein